MSRALRVDSARLLSATRILQVSHEFGFKVTMAPVFTHGVKVSEDRAGAFSLDHSRVGSPPILEFIGRSSQGTVIFEGPGRVGGQHPSTVILFVWALPAAAQKTGCYGTVFVLRYCEERLGEGKV